MEDVIARCLLLVIGMIGWTVAPLFEPSGLSGWVEAVKQPQFELLKASKQHGMYFAVFRDPSGDLAICHYVYRYGALPSTCATEVRVRDLQGKDVRDLNSRGDLTRELEKAGMTWRFGDGEMYRLTKPVPHKVRVSFSVDRIRGEDDSIIWLPIPFSFGLGHFPLESESTVWKETTLFDEIIDLK